MIFNSTFWNETEDEEDIISGRTFGNENDDEEDIISSCKFGNEQQILGHVHAQRSFYAYYILDPKNPNTITVDVTEDSIINISNQPKNETVN